MWVTYIQWNVDGMQPTEASTLALSDKFIALFMVHWQKSFLLDLREQSDSDNIIGWIWILDHPKSYT